MPAISLAKAPQPAATDPAQIRNFAIIAHIDHGKSTLADRMLGITEVVDPRNMRAQYLDRMDIERERGITIKSQAVRLPWRSGLDGKEYILNMIDTPGHVDFTYEVSRSLAASEGAILLVDCAQGIEAQTLANLYLAMENNLKIIPVLNKIDLPAAQPEKFAKELAKLIGCEPSDCLLVSGKTGAGVADLLDNIAAAANVLERREPGIEQRLRFTGASLDVKAARREQKQVRCGMANGLHVRARGVGPRLGEYVDAAGAPDDLRHPVSRDKQRIEPFDDCHAGPGRTRRLEHSMHLLESGIH